MIKPAGYRILIKPRKVEEKTAGGIIIPDTTKEREQFRQMISDVVSVGEFAYHDYPANWVKAGDVVITKEYPGMLVKDPCDNEEYRIINDEDILGILTDEPIAA